MKYDFDTVIDRKNTNCMKWDVKENELPMWVADMDFETAPEVKAAIAERAKHGVFGYTIVPDEWYDAIIGWWQTRHDFTINREWLMFCTGVVPAISSIVRKCTTVNENVVVLTPTYNIFFNSIYNNGRRILECPLSYDGSSYSIDFEDLETKLRNPQTSMLIFCNPHNPIGKIWDAGTIRKVGELCKKYHVIVVSDEIHCDLTDPGKDYIPFASVSETCRDISITCIAPTKSFNIAGLQTAAIMIPDETLRYRVNRAINTDEVAEPNVFAVDAAIAAFTKGADWLDSLRRYIYENKKRVTEFIHKEIPQLSVVSGESTYLLWIDCSQVTDDSEKFADFIRSSSGLYLSDGCQYGGDGKRFLRMNVACSRTSVEDGLKRLKLSCNRWNQ